MSARACSQIGTQLIAISGLAGIIARGLNAASQAAGASDLKPANIIPLPTRQRDRDRRQRPHRRISVRTDGRVPLAGDFVGPFYELVLRHIKRASAAHNEMAMNEAIMSIADLGDKRLLGHNASINRTCPVCCLMLESSAWMPIPRLRKPLSRAMNRAPAGCGYRQIGRLWATWCTLLTGFRGSPSIG